MLKGKRTCLWEYMLKAISYEDMGVVKEFTEGSHLVGSCDVTGLWPKKFAPATMTKIYITLLPKKGSCVHTCTLVLEKLMFKNRYGSRL